MLLALVTQKNEGLKGVMGTVGSLDSVSFIDYTDLGACVDDMEAKGIVPDRILVAANSCGEYTSSVLKLSNFLDERGSAVKVVMLGDKGNTNISEFFRTNVNEVNCCVVEVVSMTAQFVEFCVTGDIEDLAKGSKSKSGKKDKQSKAKGGKKAKKGLFGFGKKKPVIEEEIEEAPFVDEQGTSGNLGGSGFIGTGDVGYTTGTSSLNSGDIDDFSLGDLADEHADTGYLGDMDLDEEMASLLQATEAVSPGSFEEAIINAPVEEVSDIIQKSGDVGLGAMNTAPTVREEIPTKPKPQVQAPQHTMVGSKLVVDTHKKYRFLFNLGLDNNSVLDIALEDIAKGKTVAIVGLDSFSLNGFGAVTKDLFTCTDKSSFATCKSNSYKGIKLYGGRVGEYSASDITSLLELDLLEDFDCVYITALASNLAETEFTDMFKSNMCANTDIFFICSTERSAFEYVDLLTSRAYITGELEDILFESGRFIGSGLTGKVINKLGELEYLRGNWSERV